MDGDPDWEYYAERLARTLSRVTEVFGWDMKGLMAGNKQSDLFSDQFKNDEKKEKKGVKKTDDPVTLQDFM